MFCATHSIFCCEYIYVSEEVISGVPAQSALVTSQLLVVSEQLLYCIHCRRWEVVFRGAHRVPASCVHIVTSGLEVRTALGVVTFTVSESTLTSLPLAALAGGEE